MPDTDLVLNVRQIAGYTPVSSAPPAGALLLQTGGLGSPYASISPGALVGTALSGGGDMAVGGQLSALSFSGGAAQFSNAAVNLLTAQQGCFREFNAEWGSIAGVPIATTEFASSLVAGLQASTVWSFMGRRGDVVLWIQDILKAGGAPIFSPRFFGTPMAPTPAANSCNSRVATTAFVHGTVAQYICGLLNGSLVTSFNGRTGAIVLTAADIEAAGATQFAPIDSPNFTGYATAPTAPIGTSDGQLATTAFVMNAVQESTTGVASWNGRTGIVTLTTADLTGAGGALIASPVFTGTPQGPTAPLGTSSAQLATTAFVMNELGGLDAGVVSFNGRSGAVTLNSTDITNAGGALAGPSVTSFNSRTGAITLTNNDVSAAGGIINPSAVLTGVPVAPTAAPGVSTTQLATCAFVMAAIAAVNVGVTSFNTRAGAVTLSGADITGAGGALASSLANYLPLTGGTLTGALTISVGGALSLTASGNASFGGSIVSGSGIIASNFNCVGASPISYWQIGGGATNVGLVGWSSSQGFLIQSTNPGWTAGSIAFDGGGNLNASVTDALKPGGGPWDSLSDARIKTVDGPYELGLAEVMQLEPVRYRFKGNDSMARGVGSPEANVVGRVFVGLIAQAVETVMPGMVKLASGFIDGQEVDDLRQLDTNELIYALVNAVKQLALRVETLEAAA